jgi:hypothetical protein
MIERSEQFRLTLETGEPFCILGQRSRKYFDGDGALQVGVGGAINLAHPTHAERTDDLILPQACTGR